MRNTKTFILCLMLCIALLLGALVAWASYLDIFAFILGAAGFVAGYFAGQEIEYNTTK